MLNSGDEAQGMGKMPLVASLRDVLGSVSVHMSSSQPQCTFDNGASRA
jgi:hypothetical protein